MSKQTASSSSEKVEQHGAPPGRPYKSLVKMVEDLFAIHGDSHRGLGYPKATGFDARYRVYLDVTKFGPSSEQSCTLLDVGCGTGRLLDEIKASGRTDITYTGIDLSPILIDAAKAKHPEAFFLQGDPFDLSEAWSRELDYVVFGGIFTCKLQMTNEEMTDYMLRLLRLAFAHCQRGLAFNVMSHHVDWQREDLFHVPFDRMADLLQVHFGRNYIFRADYGLFEYTVYLYK
jgi:SAM-dependent methyltransferase